MAIPVPYFRVNWPRKLPFEELALTTAPAMYLRLGDAAGSIAYDRWGGNHGTITGCTLAQTGLVSEDAATSYHFDGVDDRIIVPDAATLDLGDTFWVAFAFLRHATGAMTLADKGTNGWQVGLDADGYPILVKTGTATIVTGTTAITDTTTAHLLVVRKVAAASTIFLDGQDITGTVTNQTCASTATDLYIGSTAAGAGYYHGLLQEVLHGATLTDTQAFGLFVAFSQGEFGGPHDDISAFVKGVPTRARGRNSDNSGEAMSSLSLMLKNTDSRFLADRNLAPNASFESGLDGWSVAASGLTSAPTYLRAAKDAPTGGGTWCGQASLPATSGAGVWCALEGTVYSGTEYTVEIAVKSVSGNTAMAVGLGSTGTPADYAASVSTITGSWVRYTVTWTPSANRTDAIIFVRSRSASAAVLKFDAVQVNAGTTANTYLEAPTKPELDSGAKIHVYATYGGTTYGFFTGTTERLSPSPKQYEATLTAYGMERALGVPITLASLSSTAMDHRIRILDAARKTRLPYVETGENLCPNPSFSQDQTSWAQENQNYVGTNLCANPLFLTDTAGWLTTPSSGFITSGAQFTRTAGDLAYGPRTCTYHGFLGSLDADGKGAYYDLTGTFVQGKTYVPIFGAWGSDSYPGSPWLTQHQIGIGSRGTPADVATSTDPNAPPLWRPTADRTDVQMFVRRMAGSAGHGARFSYVGIYELPTEEGIAGPDDYGRPGTDKVRNQARTVTRVTDGGVFPYGLEVETRDFKGSGIGFIRSVPTALTMTASVLLWTASGTATVQLVLGPGTGTANYATRDVLVTTAKTRHSVTWTPLVSSNPEFYLCAPTDASITFRFTDIRLEFGSKVSPFLPLEAAGLSTDEGDVFSFAVANASAMDALIAISKGVGSRHWIESTMTRPFWRMGTSARNRIDTQAVAETIAPQDIIGIERDAAAVANQVTCGAVTVTDTDTVRIRRLGGIHAVTIGDASVSLVTASQTDYATRYLARYKVPRMRPKIVLVDQFSTQLARQLDDLISVTNARASFYKMRLLLQSDVTSIVPGDLWTTTFTTEESP